MYIIMFRLNGLIVCCSHVGCCIRFVHSNTSYYCSHSFSSLHRITTVYVVMVKPRAQSGGGGQLHVLYMRDKN